jgi:hypothetical protein
LSKCFLSLQSIFRQKAYPSYVNAFIYSFPPYYFLFHLKLDRWNQV